MASSWQMGCVILLLTGTFHQAVTETLTTRVGWDSELGYPLWMPVLERTVFLWTTVMSRMHVYSSSRIEVEAWSINNGELHKVRWQDHYNRSPIIISRVNDITRLDKEPQNSLGRFFHGVFILSVSESKYLVEYVVEYAAQILWHTSRLSWLGRL